MIPKTITEKLMYSTVLIETENGRGTGFFFSFKIDETTNIPVIITNKHVINYNSSQDVYITVHTRKKLEDMDENIRFHINADWFFHDTQDLCFCFFQPIATQIKETHKTLAFYIPIEEDLIYDDEKLKSLSAVEDILMVGYPIGLCDIENNYPIFRKGITSSHPATDFNDKNIGLIDTACFPGSSGSPIFIINENGYSDKNGTTYLGAKRVIFLGILFSGPTFNASGKLEIIEIPTSQSATINTQVMVNLGYYVKAEEIYDLKKKAFEIYKKTNNQ